ncbi:HEAT repeats family protein [Chlamydia ibidis]|uniref:HEAT repeats family protein n=2 Tax=Chlamydia ibidis TaxID=1405396 RepID=S7J1R8_9CHLA|nr:HEAT repeat domain-containing protein [Chlamydia ibidis]EPP34339.1 HEAT repeats family protein [Chlamydia ibidis]EQM63176.1 HEAT repeat family protein [Chlamydia ibidis 10-1398/6]
MGLSSLALFLGLLLALSTPAFGKFPDSTSHKILYTNRNSLQQSLVAYLEAFDLYGEHDFAILRKIAEECLRQGLCSSDPYIRRSSITGAGLVGSSEALDILSQAMDTTDPSQQLLVLSAASAHVSHTSDELLFKALSSPYPIIRLEAAYRLANLKNIKVIDHLHSFIGKLPEEIQSLCAAIFLKLETTESDTYVRQLLSSPRSTIRNYTSLLIGEYGQKRFLPTLRNLLTSASPLDKEGAIYALGKLQDGHSYPKIKKLLQSTDADISLAAAQALIHLGKEEEAISIFEQQIAESRPRAIYTSRFLSKELAIPLILPVFLNTQEDEVKLNAGLALLHLQCDHPCLINYFVNWLTKPNYTQTIVPTFSKGRATQSWKRIGVILPDSPVDRAKALSVIQNTEEHVLTYLLQLRKEVSLPIVKKIVKSEKTALASKAIAYLSHTFYQEAIDILSEASSLPGEPIIRAYADLALYNLTKNPEKKQALHRHAQNLIHETLLFVDMEEKHPRPNSPYLRYQIAPETRAQLMLDILESLVVSKTQEDIRLLIQLMTQTKAKNLHILAGLLMKIIE